MSPARLAYLGAGFNDEHREGMADYYDDIGNPEIARLYRHTHEELLRLCVYILARDRAVMDDAFDHLDEIFGT